MAQCSWPCNFISHLLTPAGADTVAETCKGRLKGQRRLCDASAICLRSLLGWVGEEAGLPGVHLPSGRPGRSDPLEAQGRPLVPCRSRLTGLEGGSSFWLGVWGSRPVLPTLCYDVCTGTASWGLCHEQAVWLLLDVLWGGCAPQRVSQVALAVKNLPASAGDAGDVGSTPVSGRSPGGGHGNPLQDSCLENPMVRGACWAYSSQGHKELDKTYRLSTLTCLLEGFFKGPPSSLPGGSRQATR